jgi:hypothetical protein
MPTAYWQYLDDRCLLRHCWQELAERILSAMTAWILLLALAALFAVAVRHGRPAEPRMPSGFDGERQLAELRALVSSTTNIRLP